MRKLIALVALAATAACSTDTSTAPYVLSLAGSYSLRTVDGASLPYTVMIADTTFVTNSDVLLMTDAGDWSETVGFRQTVGAAAPTEESVTFLGTWSRVGNNVSFRLSNTQLYVGLAAVDTLTLFDGRSTYVFAR